MTRALVSRFGCSPLVFAALIAIAHGHGRLTVPMARNGGDNGAVGGGPGAVHAFGEYAHGICGNAAGVPQVYNKVGEIQETYTAGSTVEFKVVITAHHVGYFEFELCADAGQLSETCFMEHRLLKEGCQCTCPDDSTNSCSACDACRRWWKPLLEGELDQVVTEGYEGPNLPGQGNLVPYEYTMRYIIPANIKTSRGVLRWHYMTTNSCTSKSSAPEEFWNCADVAVSSADGDVGEEIAFSNSDLEEKAVQNLIPAMQSEELTGVYARCPEDDAGNLLGVGAADDYQGLCGSLSDGVFDKCADLSSGSGSVVDCSEPPASGILCESECSESWFQCDKLLAYTKYVPAGTKCKGNKFVLAAACDDYQAPEPEPEPEPSPPPSVETTGVASTTAPTSASTSAPTPASTTPAAPTPTPVTSPPTKAPSGGRECGACAGCLWSTGICYDDVDAAYCGHWPKNLWCGSGMLSQIRPGSVKRHAKFLGAALIQQTARVENAPAEIVAVDEL